MCWQNQFKIYQSCQSWQELLQAKVTAPPFIVYLLSITASHFFTKHGKSNFFRCWLCVTFDMTQADESHPQASGINIV